MKSTIIVILSVLLFASCHTTTQNKALVVATNSWTAALAQTAGATEIVVLAPYEMEHPSEYELRPGDIPKLMDASLIIYAGYESMAERIKNGMDVPEEKMLKVETTYAFEQLSASVLSIAEKIGTTEIALQNLNKIAELYNNGKAAIAASPLSGQPVLVQYFQLTVAKELGLNIAGHFGPAPLEANQIAQLAQSQAVLIIDNIHNPVGEPLHEVISGSSYQLFLNFPGLKNTRSLEDVIRYNINQISNIQYIIKQTKSDE